jgi:hypothetical protein
VHVQTPDREQYHIGFLLDESRRSTFERGSRHIPAPYTSDLSWNGTCVGRRVIVNYACHMFASVPYTAWVHYNSWCRVFLQKVWVAQLVKKIFAFMKEEDSLTCLQDPVNPSQLSPVHILTSYFSNIYFIIILPSLPRSSKWSSLETERHGRVFGRFRFEFGLIVRLSLLRFPWFFSVRPGKYSGIILRQTTIASFPIYQSVKFDYLQFDAT